jgi:hypothetical protein
MIVVGRLVQRRVVERRHNGAKRRQLERKLYNETDSVPALSTAVNGAPTTTADTLAASAGIEKSISGWPATGMRRAVSATM